jgi:hypothetical protein
MAARQQCTANAMTVAPTADLCVLAMCGYTVGNLEFYVLEENPFMQTLVG